MATKSKRRATVSERKPDPRRPFEAAVLAQAREIASRYQIVVWSEDGEFFGRGVELPHAMNDGRTAAECIEKTRDILATTVATMIEDGDSPPPPAIDGVRSEQGNVRVTAEEKMTLESFAQRQGFRGAADFMRSSANAATRGG